MSNPWDGLSDDELMEKLRQLPPHELVVLRWHLQRYNKQIPPDPLPFIWFLLGGRGSGKTLTGANHVYEIAKNTKTAPGKPVRVALISETHQDVKNTMIEGETGLRSIIPREMELAWNRSMGEYRIAIPGPIYKEIHFKAFSSETPEQLRGPQHHIVWLDEPAKLKDSDKEPTDPSTTYSNMMMGLRLGDKPHCIVTGTPEPHKLIKHLVAHPDCVTHVMPSTDNWENLPKHTKAQMERLPKTSRTYRQEVLAEILLDNPDSIFSQEMIEENRGDATEDLRLVLGYDPSMTSNAESDETGIILGGFTVTEEIIEGNKEKHIDAYILEDHSGHLDPTAQARIVTDLIMEREIPEVIIEQNQGADFVLNNFKSTLQNHEDVAEFYERQMKKKPTKAGTIKRWRITIIYKDRDRPAHSFILYAIHAKQGKALRADSVAIRYESGQVHHPTDGLPICEVQTCRASLEDQMVLWDGSKKDSPDRMDAAVYVLMHIFGSEHALSGKSPARVSSPARAKNLPSYDPRTNAGDVTQDKMSKHSRAYTIDVLGGSSDFTDRPSIAGPRRIPSH